MQNQQINEQSEIYQQINKLSLSKEEKQEVFSNLSFALQTGNFEKIFTYVSSGSYKDVYFLDSSHSYVLKLVSIENDTEEEKHLLSIAKQERVYEVFLQTLFIPLYTKISEQSELITSRSEPLTRIGFSANATNPQIVTRKNEQISESNEHMGERRINERFSAKFITYDGDLVNYLQIQPCVNSIVSDLSVEERYHDFRSETRYNYNPLHWPDTNEIIPFELINNLNVYYPKWIYDVIKCYGKDFLAALGNFVQRYQITDLHSDNIGYYNNKPVILDFFSRSTN